MAVGVMRLPELEESLREVKELPVWGLVGGKKEAMY